MFNEMSCELRAVSCKAYADASMTAYQSQCQMPEPVPATAIETWDMRHVHDDLMTTYMMMSDDDKIDCRITDLVSCCQVCPNEVTRDTGHLVSHLAA